MIELWLCVVLFVCKNENVIYLPSVVLISYLFHVDYPCDETTKARLEDSGKYLCWVNNTAGEETIQVALTVTGKN